MGCSIRLQSRDSDPSVYRASSSAFVINNPQARSTDLGVKMARVGDCGAHSLCLAVCVHGPDNVGLGIMYHLTVLPCWIL